MLRNQDSSMFLLFAIFSFFSLCKINLNLGMVKLTKRSQGYIQTPTLRTPKVQGISEKQPTSLRGIIFSSDVANSQKASFSAVSAKCACV